MGEVTGYTAARMKAIEDASVVNGEIDVDNHLILTRFDESEIDAGLLGNNPLRDTAANLAANNPVVEAGRLIVTTDVTPILFAFGDGVTGWNTLQKFMQQGYPEYTNYTPQVDQGGTTNIAKTVTYAKYAQNGKHVKASVRLAMTGAGTGSNPIKVSLPVTAVQANDTAVGVGFVKDVAGANVGFFGGVAVLTSTTRVAFMQASGSLTLYVGDTTGSPTNMALASGDLISFTIEYEAA